MSVTVKDLSIPVIITAAGFLITYVFIFNTKTVSQENNAYVRGVACILSINASGRTQAQIEKCWQTVQRETGVHVRRYDKEINQ